MTTFAEDHPCLIAGCRSYRQVRLQARKIQWCARHQPIMAPCAHLQIEAGDGDDDGGAFCCSHEQHGRGT